MIKKLINLITLCIPIIFLTSCWDSEDINKKCIAVSIGVDYINENIEFSGEIAKLSSVSQKEESKAQATSVYKILGYGKTFEEARVSYDANNPYPTFLGATRVAVFGENFAKTGIESYLNRIDSLYDYRKTLLAVVSREPPKELFDLKIEKDISVGFLIENILIHLKKKGQVICPNVGQLLSDIALGQVGCILPYMGIEEDSIRYLGLAVIKEAKFIGVIDILDTNGILYLLSENPVHIQSMPSLKDPNNIISFRITIKKRKITTSYAENNVIINIDLDLNSELRYQYNVNEINDEEIKQLEDMISDEVKNEIVTIIKRAQDEFKSDIFHFAKYFRAQNPQIYKEIDWEDAFIMAKVNVNVTTKNTNMNLRDPNAKLPTEDENNGK